MRIACLVTVCGFLISSVSVAEASLVNGAKRGRSDSRQMQSRISTADGSSNSTVGYQELFHGQRRTRATTHASVAKRPRRPASTQTPSNQTIQMQQNKRDRSRRHLRRNKSRQGRIGRSFDLIENQIEEFPVLPTKYLKEGAIYIEPIARVVTKKGILDSLMDLVKKVFEPSEQKLGPLVGPIKFPGVGDKVYVRLLESPEHGPNHVTLRLITREPVPFIEPEILSTTVIKDDSFHVLKGETFIKGDAFNGIKGISFAGLKGGETLHGVNGDVFHGEVYHGINGDTFDGNKGESFGVIKGGESLRAVLPTATVVEHLEASGTRHEHQQVLPTPISSDSSAIDTANRPRRLVPHSTKSPYKDQSGQETKNGARGAGREQQGGDKSKSSERLKGSKEVTGGDGKKETIITGTRGHPWGNLIDASVRPTMTTQTTSRHRYPTYATQFEGQKSPTREAFQLEEGLQTHTRYAPQSHGTHIGSGSKNNGNRGNGHSQGTGNMVTEPTYSNNYGQLGSGVRYPTAQGESNSNLPENSFQPSPMIQYYPDYRDHYYAESYRPEVYNNSRVPKHVDPHEPFESFLVRSTLNPTILPAQASSVPSTAQNQANYQDKSALRVIQAPNFRTSTTQPTPSYYRRTTPSYYEHQKKKAEELLQIEAAMGELRKLESPVEWQPVSMMNTWANSYTVPTTAETSTQRSAINKNSGVGGRGRVELPNSSNLDNYREKVEESKQSAWSPFVDLLPFVRHASGEENRESMSLEPTSLRKKKARTLANENVGFASESMQPAKGPIKVVKVIKKPYYPANITTPRPVATVKPQVKATSRPQVQATPKPTAKPTVKPTITSALNSAAVPVASLAAIPMQNFPPMPVAQPVAMPPPKQVAIPQLKSAMPPPQPQPLPAAKPAPMPAPMPVQAVAKPTAKPALQPVIKPTMKSHAKPVTTPATFKPTTKRPTRPAPTQKSAPTPKYGSQARSATTTRPTKTTKNPPTSSGAKSLIHKLFKSTTPRAGIRFPKLKLTTASSAKAA